MKYRKWIILISLSYLTSCKSYKYVSSIESLTQQVNSNYSGNNYIIDSMVLPYKTIMNQKMNDTIAFNPSLLNKERIESTMGNWVADGMKWYVDSVLNLNSDIAICNYGGLRTGELLEGSVQTKHIYELMPFENLLTIVELDSNTLKQVLERIASSNGWPISKELRIIITNNNKVESWKINNNKLNNYRVIFSDYLANGGDNMKVLEPLKKIETKVLIRDALISFAKHQKIINAFKDGRCIKNK